MLRESGEYLFEGRDLFLTPLSLSVSLLAGEVVGRVVAVRW